MEKVTEISTAMVAFSTIIGVAGAVGTFLLNLGVPHRLTFIGILIYISITFIFLVLIKRSLP